MADEFQVVCTNCNKPNTFKGNQLLVGQSIMCYHCERVFIHGGKQAAKQYQTTEPDSMGRSEERHGSPRFYKLLEEMADTHSKKSHDYASNENPYGNYHFAGHVSSMFSHSPEDAGFAGRLAEKIFRISNLESGGKNAKNESIEDTERDICVIAALWMADRRDRRAKISIKSAAASSEDCLTKLIEMEPYLTIEHRQQAISYLQNCQRDQMFIGPLKDLELGQQSRGFGGRKAGEPEPPQQR